MRMATISMAAMVLAVVGLAAAGRTEGVTIPAASTDATIAAPGSSDRTAVLAGGCFGGVQAVFQHVHGVRTAVSGYAGGSSATARYEVVSGGRTGHVESVEVTYDPSTVTYGQLLRVFVSVAHDPTTMNRHGPDEGTQYRSAIFVADAEQERIARAYIDQLTQTQAFRHPIVTAVTTLQGFYPAEAYHQNYATLHPTDPYIAINDAPKILNLQKLLPELYVPLQRRQPE